MTPANVGFSVFSDVECSANVVVGAQVTGGSLDSGLGYNARFAAATNFNVAFIDVLLLPAGLNVGDSIYYKEEEIAGQIRGKIEFCVRFSLKSDSAPIVEVNFQESIIIIFIDLTDGFTIDNVSVAPKERLIRTSTEAYEVEASFCTGSGTGTINQGSVVCVEVIPEARAQASGLVMRKIDSFEFTSSNGLVQAAVLDGTAVDLLTAHSSCDNLATCTWSTILRAEFYTPLTAAEGGVAGGRVVTGSGVASMRFGDGTGRRLQKEADTEGYDGRELQEEDGAGASEFDLTFEVNPAAPLDESSAASVAYGLVFALLGLSMVM